MKTHLYFLALLITLDLACLAAQKKNDEQSDPVSHSVGIAADSMKYYRQGLKKRDGKDLPGALETWERLWTTWRNTRAGRIQK